MAEVTLTLRDTPAGTVALLTNFVPAIGAATTPAQGLALDIIRQHRHTWGAEIQASDLTVSTVDEPTARFDLLAHLAQQIAFSERTFGPGTRMLGVIDHICNELVEVQLARAQGKSELEEWIDIVILAFDGAWRSGASAADIVRALVAKQRKNEGRQWPDWRTAEPGKAIEHIRAAGE